MNILIVSQNSKLINPTAISFSFIRALEELGHQCEMYDLSYYLNKYLNFFVKNNIRLRQSVLKKINEGLLKYLKKNQYDIVFVVKGTYMLPETVKEISKSTWIACFNPDDPFNKETWGGSNHPNIPNSISSYSHYFIWSKNLMQKIENEGGTSVSYMPFAVDPLLIKKFKNTNKKYDLSFIGNGDQERQYWLNGIGERLVSKGMSPVVVFGKYWNKSKGVEINLGRFGDEYFKTFYQSKCNINILRAQNKGATNMRTFEVPATSNFMLHEDSEEAKLYFPEDKAVVYFSSVEELVDKGNYYSNNEKERKKIEQFSYELSQKENHTYKGRMRDFIRIAKSEC